MKTKFVPFFFFGALCALMFSCLTPHQTNSWLDSRKGVPSINITGEWDAGPLYAGGWGGASIVQNGNTIVGTMGLYNVYGVVNGDDVYLVFKSGAKIYYTGHLKPSKDGSLIGVAAEGAFADEEGGNATRYPIIMKKIGNIEKK
jgi:hypothetical protein